MPIMPRTKSAPPRTASDYTGAYRARRLETGSRRLDIVLRPEAAAALDKLRGSESATAAIERLLIEAAGRR